MRTRKSVKTLTEIEKERFVDAVLALKISPSILHPGNTGLSRYDDFVETYRNSASAQEGPAFLPWHREFILQFENSLAAIDESVTLPYWDWTDASLEADPLTANFLGGNGSGADQIVSDGPFAGPARWKLNVRDDPGDPNYLQRDCGADGTAQALPTAGLQYSVLSVATYDAAPWKGVTNTFRWQCETALHNLVQRYIGGTIDTATAPNDPVFFLHHANIDRLYAMWQGLHPASAHYLPVSGGRLGHNLHDPLLVNPSFQSNATPASVLSHRELGYQYDTETQVSLGTMKIVAANLQVLYGILNDAPCAALTPTGQMIHVPGGPGDPWAQLTPAARDSLIGLAVNELAAQIGDKATRVQLQSAVAGLAGNAGPKVKAASS